MQHFQRIAGISSMGVFRRWDESVAPRRGWHGILPRRHRSLSGSIPRLTNRFLSDCRVDSPNPLHCLVPAQCLPATIHRGSDGFVLSVFHVAKSPWPVQSHRTCGDELVALTHILVKNLHSFGSASLQISTARRAQAGPLIICDPV